MQRVAVISDTHIPERASEIPEWATEHIRAADHVVHVGDFTTETVLETVQSLAGSGFSAVTGNMDPSSLGLTEVATLAVEDVTFVLTHGTGDLQGYERRVARTVTETADETAIGLAGHTHEPLDAIVDGVRILNPGSVTGADPASAATMLTVDVEGSDVEVTIHDE